MHELFRNDRIIVEGEYREYNTPCTEDIKTELNRWVELKIHFQVNGKLTTCYFNFQAEIDNDIEIGKPTLKNWNEWHHVASLFSSMGYHFNPGELGYVDSGVMKIWIHKMVELNKNA